MSNCINNMCRLCHNLVISDSVSVVTVGGVDTLVIDIPADGCYCNGKKVCLVVAQNIPTTTTITAPVAISIGGDTTTVYPVVGCDCAQVTACAIRTRTKYALMVKTNATSAVFRSLKPLACYPTANLASIPAATAVAGASEVVLRAATTSTKTATKTAVKEAQ